MKGPALLVSNHTTNIEGPAYYVFIQPRRATALGKRELWDNPFTRFFMKTWDVIPVRRSAVDRAALRAAVAALDDGQFLGVAPEGTRSKTGKLRRAHPGIALLATTRRVPIYPMVHWGFLELGRNLKRLRRTRVEFRIGRPFVVRIPEATKLTSAALRQITDEMMYEVARVLPASMRGAYEDLENHASEYLEYIDENN
jgi:1-acyl-sn-glycerol-3-phosphate acyltransferase